MEVKEVAQNMMKSNSRERREAEKIMGRKFEDMTPEQRTLAAECIAAFCHFDNHRHSPVGNREGERTDSMKSTVTLEFTLDELRELTSICKAANEYSSRFYQALIDAEYK